jgi:thermopsin
MRAALALVLLAAALAPALKAFAISLSSCASYLANATYVGLPSGYYYWSIAVAGPATVQIRADLTATAPVEVAVISSGGGFIYQTQPSQSLSGEYDVSINGSGIYYVAVYNPSGSAVDVYGWLAAQACGPYAPAGWVRGFLALHNTTLGLEMAPMGVAAYGVVNASGAYYAYTLETDAVMGKAYIPSGVSASDYSSSGSYYGDAFSVQLNAYVAVQLADGRTQYYWAQDVVMLENGALWVDDNVWNASSTYSHLSSSAIRGNGQVSGGQVYLYGMPGTSSGSVPFGWVTLEISAGVIGGSAVIRFYADGQNYDTVYITPSAPATSAYIVIAPATTIGGLPLDLELVFAGLGGDEPYAVLQSGSLQLQLYVDVNGAWTPPPSAWSVGYSTYEKGYAAVSSNGMGSAAVSPGPSNVAELWSGTIVVGPTGVVATTDTDLTQYLPQALYFNNGTRLFLEAVYINGEPAPYSALGDVPVGSLVIGRYVKQYYVTIEAPGNTTAGWYDVNSTLYVQPVVYLGNLTRLVEPTPAEVVVSGPLNITVEYARQYYVAINSPINATAGWYNAGSIIVVEEPPVVNLGNSTRLVEPKLNGRPLPVSLEVDGPINATVSYTKQFYVVLRAPGNTTADWYNAGAVLAIQPVVYFGNGTRLTEPRPAQIVVSAPINATVEYTRQYYVVISAPSNVTGLWVDAGSSITVSEPPVIDFGNSTRLVRPEINGTPLPYTVTVDRPLDIAVEYTRQYYVTIEAPGNATGGWYDAGSTLYIQAVVDFGKRD